MAGNTQPGQATALFRYTGPRDLAISFCIPVILLFALWLWPFAYGPLAAVWPDLFAWTIGLCLGLLLMQGPQNMAGVVAVACLGAALTSSFLGVAQYFELGEALFPLLVRAELGMAYANLRQVNHLATLLAVGFWALLWLSPSWTLSKVVLYVCGLILAVGMAATASRTGAMQFLFVALLVLMWRKPGDLRTVYFVGVVLLSYVGAAAMLPWLLEYFTGYEARVLFDRMWMNQGCSSRGVLWSNVLHLISLKPWTGWGLGELAYAHYITLYDGLRFCGKLSNAHNLILHTAAVVGIPVALVFTMVLGSGVCYLKPWREIHRDRRLVWGVIGLLLIHSMLEYPLWFGNFQVLGLLCVAVLWLTHKRELANVALPSPNQKRWISVTALVMMLALGWRGWDYLRVSQLYLPAKDRLASFEFDTLNKARKAVLFSDEVIFAQVNNATPDPLNAKVVLSGALVSVHGYPEPRIVQKLILAALLIGDTQLGQYHATRFKAAWPEEYAEFLISHTVVAKQLPLTP